MLSVRLVLAVFVGVSSCIFVNSNESPKYCMMNTGRCEYRIELHDQTERGQCGQSLDNIIQLQSDLQLTVNELNYRLIVQTKLVQELSAEKQSLVKKMEIMERDVEALKQQSSVNTPDLHSTGCPEGFIPFRQSCYRFSTFKTNHDIAVKYCEHLNGSHLVYIEHEEEQYFLMWTILETEPSSYWTGAILPDGSKNSWDWMWEDVEEVSWTYNNWLDDSYDEGNDCSLITPDLYKWQRVTCSTSSRIICETKRHL